MQCHRWLRYIAAVAVFRAGRSAMSLLHIPDGPVGLPSNVRLRTEQHQRRRHRNDPPPPPSSMPPTHIDEAVASDIAKSAHSLQSMQDEIKEEQIQGIHLDLPEAPPRLLSKVIPEFINHLPSNMMSAKSFITDSTSSLMKMGLQAVLGTQVFSNVLCTANSNEAEMLICVTELVTNMSRIIDTGVTVLMLNYRVLSGGRTAVDALVRLNTLAADPVNNAIMKLLGCTAVLYITLMREAIPDDTKVLAGSIMTQLTSLPVVSNVAHTSSGGFGRVNVVIPRPSRVHRADYDIAKLQAGATERDLLSYTA
ncbi:uncharacterized protein BcabD6B2_20980 [Babesia caballi]|uniref:Membrane protein, putative n=1 Tax=Babesia caballi TaxID=5871 RepID=A0AAV4LRS7_BABCB|nr:membrane protein, putative [Babesia caballi]